MSIIVEGLSYAYGKAKVLEEVSFTATTGKLLTVLGPNGVGKSTLFKCILGMLSDYQGSILLNGKDAKQLKEQQLAKQVAYIPQTHNPTFDFSVFDTVLMGTTHCISSFASPGFKEKEMASRAIAQMGIECLRDRGYNTLSGGEKQLVLMARAMAQNAKILLLDEPTANLDYGNQIKVLQKMHLLAKEGFTIVQSCHNPEQAFLFSDDILVLKGGRCYAFGPPSEIVTESLMKEIYDVDIILEELCGGQVRICIPRELLKEK